VEVRFVCREIFNAKVYVKSIINAQLESLKEIFDGYSIEPKNSKGIDAYRCGVWRKVMEMLEEGRSRREVLDFLGGVFAKVRKRGVIECYFCGLTFTDRGLEEHMGRSHTWSLRW